MGSLAPKVVADLAMARVSVPGPGKHHVRECAEYEKRWRHHIPDVISRLCMKSRVCIVWATGPMEWNNLARVYAHILGPRTDNRYHVESITCMDRDGFVYGWLSFEYSRDTFLGLLADLVNLEYTRLEFLIVEDGERVSELMCRPYWTISLKRLLENDELALLPFSHFEGMHIVGKRKMVDEAIERVRASMPTRSH